MFKGFTFLALLGLMLVGCANVKPVEVINKVLSDRGYELHRDLPYAEGARHTMDLYFSKVPGADLKPTIVFVYGGAWRSGEKQAYKFVGHALAELGHHVVIPNYRLYPEVKFPAFINDIALAMKKAEQIFGKLSGADVDSFVLMGHSAGAHTAALLSSDPQYLAAVNLNAKVSGLIALAGPYDLDLEDLEVAPVFLPLATPDNAKITRQNFNDMPPTLLIHGKKDKRVGVHHAQKLVTALKASNVYVEAKLYDKATHVSVMAGLAKPIRFLSDSFSDIQKFLRRY